MKTLVKLILTGLIVFTFASCSKELSQETGGEVDTGNNFYATINGESWKADSLEQVLVTDSLVTISGLSKTSQEISLVLPSFAVGKYSVNASSFGYGLYTTLSTTPTDVYLTNSSPEAAKAGGTIEITSIDTTNKTITGTFSFTGFRAADQSTVSVTAGAFTSLAYSRTGGSGAGGGTDTAIVDNGNDTLSAFVNDVFVKADPSSNVSAVLLDNGGVSYVNVTGSNNETPISSFSFTFPTDLAPGSHAITYTGSVLGFYVVDFATFYAPVTTEGTIKILTNDAVNKRITAQFSFTGQNADNPTDASDVKVVSKGYFGVTYQ